MIIIERKERRNDNYLIAEENEDILQSLHGVKISIFCLVILFVKFLSFTYFSSVWLMKHILKISLDKKFKTD